MINGVLLGYRGKKSETVTIPDGVTVIAEQALESGVYSFDGGPEHWIKEIILTEGVREIGARAFVKLKKLERVTFPAGLRKIGAEAFEYTVLKELILPEGVEYIGARAFHDLPLFEVRLPKSLNYIGDEAFCGCRSMRDLYTEADETKLGERILGAYEGYAEPSGIYVHTPAGSAMERYVKEHYDSVHVTND